MNIVICKFEDKSTNLIVKLCSHDFLHDGGSSAKKVNYDSTPEWDKILSVSIL